MFTMQVLEPPDVPQAVHFIRCMLEDMEAMGGYNVPKDPAGWEAFTQQYAADLHTQQHFCYFAISAQAEVIGLIDARVTSPGLEMAPRKSLHISALYILPAMRRQGIARELMHAAIAWGKDAGCIEVDLHVLIGNPAHKLYQSLGFRDQSIKMARPL